MMVEKPWRVISNADGVDGEFATLAEALKEADEVLAPWRDQAREEGWDEDVKGVEIHLVTHAARVVSREEDEDGGDDRVDYGMTELTGNEIDDEMTQLSAERDKYKALAEGVLVHRVGELPNRGWLEDNDRSRAALQAMAEAVRG